jgi:anti-sigma regulatory factor (Ser/Thr protein kinase)
MADDMFDIQVGVPSMMAAGRHTLRDQLHGWGCSNVDDVVLVFSELVTNALMHTTGVSTTVITHGPPTVRIEVHDVSPSIPELRHDTRAGGFGLRIIGQLSDDWGWDHTSIGKVVWSTMPCGH